LLSTFAVWMAGDSGVIVAGIPAALLVNENETDP